MRYKIIFHMMVVTSMDSAPKECVKCSQTIEVALK